MHSTISTVDRISPSEAGRRRLLSQFAEPLFLARWDRAVFINYSADPDVLQPEVPFKLDLHDGRAFVSVVAFTLVRMRPRIGGRWTEWLLKSIATHEFLNIRTYVRENDEPGIYFLSEWLNNRASVLLGPRSFGLPYRFGRIAYDHGKDGVTLRGAVDGRTGGLDYTGKISSQRFGPCKPGSLSEFLLERYTAFTRRGKHSRFFRVWHSPWAQAGAEIELTADPLIASTGRWWQTAEYIGGNYSPGADVWMGRPHRITQR